MLSSSTLVALAVLLEAAHDGRLSARASMLVSATRRHGLTALLAHLR